MVKRCDEDTFFNKYEWKYKISIIAFSFLIPPLIFFTPVYAIAWVYDKIGIIEPSSAKNEGTHTFKFEEPIDVSKSVGLWNLSHITEGRWELESETHECSLIIHRNRYRPDRQEGGKIDAYTIGGEAVMNIEDGDVIYPTGECGTWKRVEASDG